MIFIVLATLTGVLMLVILRWLDSTQSHVFYALIFNYLSAFVCGILNKLFFYSQVKMEIGKEAWALTVMEGILFITVFYWMAQTTKYYGLSVTAVANKMSLIFPVMTAHLIFKEPMDGLKWLGLLLALISIYLVTYNGDEKQVVNRKKIIFPILVFIGSGIIDSIINYGNKTYIQGAHQQLVFTTFVYLFALLTGLVYMKIVPADKNGGKKFYYQESFSWKNTIFLGILLGIPNFYNLFFIIQALSSGILLSSQIFLILNLSNIVLSTIVGVFFFNEKKKWINWLGILTALLSVGMIR
ncbi:MAG: hypothetical protein D6799_05730 [Bacteroidetes bacterium]|jgi:drug/metabolite transporter (DMT)-like permease|nr:MAG: hypothetical protein D6799_05730 [Bacteroidota bacterium]